MGRSRAPGRRATLRTVYVPCPAPSHAAAIAARSAVIVSQCLAVKTTNEFFVPPTVFGRGCCLSAVTLISNPAASARSRSYPFEIPAQLHLRSRLDFEGRRNAAQSYRNTLGEGQQSRHASSGRTRSPGNSGSPYHERTRHHVGLAFNVRVSGRVDHGSILSSPARRPRLGRRPQPHDTRTKHEYPHPQAWSLRAPRIGACVRDSLLSFGFCVRILIAKESNNLQ